LRARTQDSLAVSSSTLSGDDGQGWHVVNASPDILQQITNNPPLHPRQPRHTPIRSILLTNGDLDHVLGLFSLRESWPLVLYATAAVRHGLEERNAIFRTLKRFPTQVTWRLLELGREVALDDGLSVEARPARGKLPVHLEGIATASPEDNVSLWLRDTKTGARAVYLGATSSADGMHDALRGVDCVFMDGTFWSSDEMIKLGLSKARAEDMAHLPIGGDRGSLALLEGLAVKRIIYTHINNTNPILVDGSPEARAVTSAGWEIAHDGMEITL
jgi:pyrroloquinoline quinone biosynthesis protein B